MVSPEDWYTCPECDGDGDNGDLLFPRPCLGCHGRGEVAYSEWDEEE